MYDVIDLISSSPSSELPQQPAASKKGTGSSTRDIAAVASEALFIAARPKPKRSNDYFSLSSDGPDPYAYDLQQHPTAVRVAASKPSQPKPARKDAADFFMLSEDFDSTVNFDDSFARNEPPPKRRRMSSSPAPLLPKPRNYKRTISNIEPLKTKPYARTAPVLKRSKTANRILDSDPIVFTSSPDPFADVAKKRKERNNDVWTISSDNDGIYDDRTNRSKKISKNRISSATTAGLDANDEDELPDLQDLPPMPAKRTSSFKCTQALKDYTTAKEANKTGSKPVKDAEKAAKETVKAKLKTVEERAADKTAALEAKSRDKQKAALAREAAKEAEKEQKRLAREEKVREKEMAKELAKVNTLRTDKKVSTPEMIIEMSSALDPILAAQVKRLAGPLRVDCEEWVSTRPIIKWKRKVASRFDEEEGHFVQVPLAIEPEQHILYIMEINELVDLALGDEQSNIDSHILRLKARFSSFKILYLIEGMVPWSRKNKTNKNRQFVAAVNSHLPQDAAPTANQRKRKQNDYVDEDKVEDALLQLQITHEILIHHTAAKIETAEWVIAFTQHISTIPYRDQKDSLDTAFCMESGQVKSGADSEETFTNMLQQMHGVTAPVSYGIASKYPNVQALRKGLQEGKKKALEDLKKSSNRDGAFTDKRIGPSISKRVYSVFTELDPGSTDV